MSVSNSEVAQPRLLVSGPTSLGGYVRPNEVFARNIVRAAWGVPVRDRDIETHLGLHDFDIQLPGGPEAMEVTTATSQDLRALYARFEREGTDLVKGVGDRSWQLTLNADADLSALRRRANDVATMLRNLETAGITSSMVSRNRRTNTEVDRFAERFPQVQHALAFGPSQRGPMIVLVGPGHVSNVGPELVTKMIEQFASDPRREGDRNKLRKAGTPETHLFVWIEPHEFGAYESLCDDEGLPESVPSLPPEITSIWVAAECRRGGTRVWFVRPPAPWQRIQ